MLKQLKRSSRLKVLTDGTHFDLGKYLAQILLGGMIPLDRGYYKLLDLLSPLRVSETMLQQAGQFRVFPRCDEVLGNFRPHSLHANII